MNRWFKQCFVLLSCLCFLTVACNNRTEPVKSTPPDFTGFWKGRCSDAFGVQIKKQTENLFSVSFCGPGGCLRARNVGTEHVDRRGPALPAYRSGNSRDTARGWLADIHKMYDGYQSEAGLCDDAHRGTQHKPAWRFACGSTGITVIRSTTCTKPALPRLECLSL